MGTSVLPLTFRVSPAQEYEDDFDDEEEEEEDDYGDDDFEEDDSEPSPAPKPSVSSASARSANALESDIARATRLENERAAPVAPSGLVPARDRAGGAVPERRVKGLPSRGARGGALTDAQARAARSRIKRWRLVRRAVSMTHAGAACGVESLLAAEPMTPAQMHEGGIGPYAGRAVATAQTGGDGETREFETQTDYPRGGGDECRAVAAQCPDDLSARREDLEARCALEALEASGGGGAAAVRREAAAQKAAKWARATGDLQHSREKRLAGFVARAGADAEALLRERRLSFFQPPSTSSGATRASGGEGSAFGHTDLMRARPGGSLKPHAVEGKAGSLTAAYVALEAEEVTRGRSVVAAAFAPGEKEKGTRSLLVAYAPRNTRARGAAGRGVLLVWDLGAARRAITHAMTLEGSPTCVAWGPRPPGGQGVVLCGTEEGALCAWDLREPLGGAAGAGAAAADAEDAAEASALARHGTAFRRPSYSTEGLCLPSGGGEGDAFGEPRGALVRVAAADGREAGASARDARARSGRFAFHVLALDVDGNVDAHLVSELPRREAEDAAMADVGLRFGSRVRVTRAAAGIEYGPGAGPKRKEALGGAMRAYGMCVAETPGGGAGVEFFVADDRGRVLRGARYGAAPLPRAFSVCDALDAGSAAAAAPRLATTSLDLNPATTLLSAAGRAESSSAPRLLLAAHEGGAVALYRSDRSLALRRWDGFATGSVVAVRWSLARPSLFFALDDACVVFAFDLLAADPAAPAHFEAFGAKEKIVSLELAAAGAPGRDEPGQHLMCLGYDDGRVDVHAIAPEFARITPEEVRALEAMLA